MPERIAAGVACVATLCEVLYDPGEVNAPAGRLLTAKERSRLDAWEPYIRRGVDAGSPPARVPEKQEGAEVVPSRRGGR